MCGCSKRGESEPRECRLQGNDIGGKTGGKFPAKSARSRLVHGQGTPLRLTTIRADTTQCGVVPAPCGAGRTGSGRRPRRELPEDRRPAVELDSDRRAIACLEESKCVRRRAGTCRHKSGGLRRTTISPFDQSIDRRCCAGFCSNKSDRGNGCGKIRSTRASLMTYWPDSSEFLRGMNPVRRGRVVLGRRPDRVCVSELPAALRGWYVGKSTAARPLRAAMRP
jgi:hypothetical protein